MGADKREAVRALLGGDAGEEAVERVHADFRRRLADAYAAEPPEPLDLPFSSLLLLPHPAATSAPTARTTTSSLPTIGFIEGTTSLLERSWLERSNDDLPDSSD